MKNFPVIFLLCFLAGGCVKKKSQSEPDFSNAKTTYNVSYGNDSKQSYNLFLPANRSASTTKTMILIHGGGWSSGDKADWNASISTLQSMFPGYAFVAIGYRLAAFGQNQFPTQEMDVKNAISHLMANRTEYGISDQFAIWGVSAGSHLGMLYSYKYASTGVKPKVMIETVGPTDMLAFYDQSNSYTQSLFYSLIGNRYSSDSVKYITSSPVNYITSTAPPTLILHGDADTVVPWQQAQVLHQKLDQLGVVNEYVIYPNEGHGLTGVSIDALLRMQAFVNAHM